MIYRNNIVFAIRTIAIYNSTRRLFPYYSHTLAAGALLNALSVVFADQDQDALTFEYVAHCNFPFLDRPTPWKVRKYYKTIRNGLAHKSVQNFVTIPSDDSRQISRIKITSERNSIVREFSAADLDNLVQILNHAIKEEYLDLYTQEQSESLI